MLRRSSLIAIAALLCSFSASAFASTAPSQAPVLTSSAFASPVTILWTPAADTEDDDDDRDDGQGNGQGNGRDEDDDDDDEDDAPFLQTVFRAPGPCATPAAGGRAVGQFRDAKTSAFSDPAPDGTYCYYVEVRDGSNAATSPGLTVVVDARARAAGNGALATASGIPVAAPAAGAVDKLAPGAPTRLTVSRVRATRGVHVPLTVRWANPAAADLARVELVVNRTHSPRSPADGRVIYRGKGRSAVLTLRVGQSGHLALYAVDHSGNISAAARRRVSLAALLPLRPLSGSSLRKAPLLTWKRKQGAVYYNVQVFRSGKRVLVAWPSRPSYRLPAAKLQKGTYVWFVWPALRAGSSSPKFADLIGRATFVYSP